MPWRPLTELPARRARSGLWQLTSQRSGMANGFPAPLCCCLHLFLKNVGGDGIQCNSAR